MGLKTWGHFYDFFIYFLYSFVYFIAFFIVGRVQNFTNFYEFLGVRTGPARPEGRVREIAENWHRPHMDILGDFFESAGDGLFWGVRPDGLKSVIFWPFLIWFWSLPYRIFIGFIYRFYIKVLIFMTPGLSPVPEASRPRPAKTLFLWAFIIFLYISYIFFILLHINFCKFLIFWVPGTIFPRLIQHWQKCQKSAKKGHFWGFFRVFDDTPIVRSARSKNRIFSHFLWFFIKFFVYNFYNFFYIFLLYFYIIFYIF